MYRCEYLVNLRQYPVGRRGQHLVAHGLPVGARGDTKEAKVARLMAASAVKEKERQEALTAEIEQMQIDSDPSWKIKLKI